jgi:hypothetical protein
MEELKSSIFIYYKTVRLCRVVIKLALKGKCVGVKFLYRG